MKARVLIATLLTSSLIVSTLQPVSADDNLPASDITVACNSVNQSTQGVTATINGNTATYYFYPGSPYTTSPNGQCVQFFVGLRRTGFSVTFP